MKGELLFFGFQWWWVLFVWVFGFFCLALSYFSLRPQSGILINLLSTEIQLLDFTVPCFRGPMCQCLFPGHIPAQVTDSLWALLSLPHSTACNTSGPAILSSNEDLALFYLPDLQAWLPPIQYVNNLQAFIFCLGNT